jgi:GTPase SAR1 family protein
MDNSPIPKGILKTLQSKTAKRKLIQEGLLRQVTLGNTSTSPITFKILVFGGNNCGKSTLCRALSGGSPLVQSVDGRGTINSPNETSTLGIETTTVLIASFRGRPVYLHLWEIPYDLVLAATTSNNSNPAINTLKDSSLKNSNTQLDIAFFGAHGCILVLDARDTTIESAKAVDTTRDVIQRMLSGSSRVFSDNTDYLAKMLNLHSLPPISGLGSTMMEQHDKKLIQFPIYLLAHKADHPAAFVAASGEFGKDEHSPGMHFADSQFERTHGQVNNGYPPSWYTRHPRHDIEGVSSFKYALGMSPDEIGNYARLAGFRGWWWTSSLPSILGADQIKFNIKKTNLILNNLPKKVNNSHGNNISRSNNTIINTPVSLPIGEVDDKQGKSFFSGLFGFGTSSETVGTLNKSSQGLSFTQAIPQLLDNFSASYVSTFPSITSDGSTDKSESTAPLTSLQVVFASIVDDCLEFYNFLDDSNAFAVGDDKNIQNNDLIIFF